MSRGFGPIVAVRQLSDDEPRRGVISVSLGKPRRMKGGDWECPFVVRGLKGGKTQYGNGVDAFQALTTALEGIRVALERSGRTLTWPGGLRGDNGFERLVTTSFGPQFTRRLNRVIDREFVKLGRDLKRRYREGQRRQSRTSGLAGRRR